MPLKIDQNDNFSSNFGEVLRSSAIFYYVADGMVSTTLSFLNYWALKRNLSVGIVASTRKLNGTLIKRERLSFTSGEVINYRPSLDGSFEGSVEIEIFATENLVIPYPAIMAIYQTQKGISFVHSYGRTYSSHEVEENRMITEGEEGCWSVLPEFRSFCVFHNGNAPCDSQVISVLLKNLNGETRQAKIPMSELRPYETVKIYLDQYFDDLQTFLSGKPGNASISFVLKNSFTRMLVGHETLSRNDFQVTHSNFNYSRHSTNTLTIADPVGYMHTLNLSGIQSELVVYPDSEPGSYELKISDDTKNLFKSGEIATFGLPSSPISLEFRKLDGQLPSRLVTGLRIKKSNDVIPTECSLGVYHVLRPQKRLWWGPLTVTKTLKTRLAVAAFESIYGSLNNESITVRIYSQFHKTYLEKSFPLSTFSESPEVRLLFTEVEDFLQGHIGWYTFYSNYPGFQVFSLLENAHGSLALEHAF